MPISRRHGLSLDDRVVLDTSTLSMGLAVLDRVSLVKVIIILVVLVLVSACWNPRARLIVLVWNVLARQIMALCVVGSVVTATLGEVACTGGELWIHGSLGVDPVGESVLTILNDRLAGLIAIVSSAGLTRGDWGVVDKLEQVLSITGDKSHLLAVLAQGIELVGEGPLELLTGDVGELGFGNERLGLGTHELLFEDNDSRRVWLLVLELSNLISDLLLALKHVSV